MATLVERDGSIANAYDREWSVNAPAPSTPWAMYLSGDGQRFDYLAFDLDSTKGNVGFDAGKLSLWLDELRIDHLVTESGPTGGRHVWIALEDPTAAETVREIAMLAKSLLPSLDPTPLTNPATGCVRPPGAIHRHGGSSRPLGPLAPLLARQLDAEGIEALRSLLIDYGAELPAPTPAVGHGLDVDATGRPFIPGARRELSARVHEQLMTPVTINDDASRVLTSVLNGMANANWRFEEVLTHLSAPAFERVRTVRVRDRRLPRAKDKSRDILARAWQHSVEYIATRPRVDAAVDPDGSGYLSSLSRVTAAVQALQDRANTMPGLWGADRASQAARARRGTYSRRAVLDALCLFMLQSASETVEADCRRLSDHTGYGKTITAEALLELSTPLIDGDPESAWIVRVGTRERHRGQRYRLSTRFSTGNHSPNRTKLLLAPPPSPLASRDRLLRELGARLQALCLDVFAAPHSLGRHAGNVWRHLPSTPNDAGIDVTGLVYVTGLSAAQVRVELDKLARTWMAVPHLAGWARGQANPTAIALHLDVAGYLDARKQRYQCERERWGQLLEELRWMHQSMKERRRRPPRPGSTAVPLFDEDPLPRRRPAYPRKPDPRFPAGAFDHRTARELITARHVA